MLDLRVIIIDNTFKLLMTRRVKLNPNLKVMLDLRVIIIDNTFKLRMI